MATQNAASFSKPLTVAEGGTGSITAAAARTALDVDQAGTDNSTNVTLAGTPDYITITGQEITRNLIDLTTDVTGDLPVAEGGTGASTASGARTALAVVGTADTDISTYGFVLDEDTMTSNDATKVPTQQSVKAYVDANAGGISWSEVTGTTQAAAVNSAYICNNASQVTVTLPDTAAVGSVVRVVGKGAGGWRLAQNASESIHFDDVTTTTGTGGYLESSKQYNAVSVVCITANTTWVVIDAVGDITYN